MKKIVWIRIVLFGSISFTSCGDSEYAGYNTTYYENYEPIGVFAKEPATVITFAGPGNKCEIGGPNDGQVIYWKMSSTIFETLHMSYTKKQMYTNEIFSAYTGNYLDRLIANPKYDLFFSKSLDRKALLDKLYNKTYNICLLNGNGFLFYSGEISKNPENIHQTLIMVDDENNN